jgi:hypothetical protein
MSSYGKARKQRLDPRDVRWHPHKLNEDAVAWYTKHPHKPYRGDSDGDPFVVIGRDGVARGWNGSHRAEAARRAGRKINARVHDERVSGPATSGGCALVLVAMLAVPLLMALAVAVLVV